MYVFDIIGPKDVGKTRINQHHGTQFYFPYLNIFFGPVISDPEKVSPNYIPEWVFIKNNINQIKIILKNINIFLCTILIKKHVHIPIWKGSINIICNLEGSE